FNYATSVQNGGYVGENQVSGASAHFARSMELGRNWDRNLPYQDKQRLPLTPNGGSQFDNPKWSERYNIATTNEERYIAGLHTDYTFNHWIRADYSIGENIDQL